MWGETCKESDTTEWLDWTELIPKWASLVAQMVKNLPAMWENWLCSLGEKIPWKTPSSILAWRIPWTEEPGGLWYTGSQRVGQDQVTNIHTHPKAESWFPKPLCISGPKCRKADTYPGIWGKRGLNKERVSSKSLEEDKRLWARSLGWPLE